MAVKKINLKKINFKVDFGSKINFKVASSPVGWWFHVWFWRWFHPQDRTPEETIRETGYPCPALQLDGAPVSFS